MSGHPWQQGRYVYSVSNVVEMGPDLDVRVELPIKTTLKILGCRLTAVNRVDTRSRN